MASLSTCIHIDRAPGGDRDHERSGGAGSAGAVGGLGGRDITVDGFVEIVKKGIEIAKTGSENEFEIFDVRE